MKLTTTCFIFLLLTGQSLWAQLCPPVNSYTENFEAVTAPSLPQCSTFTTTIGGGMWATVNNPGSGFTNNTLSYTGTNQAADSWFFTRGITMNANTFYKISYRYGNNSATTSESLVVTRGTAANEASSTVLNTHDNITGATPATQLIELYMNTTPGTYYFGFHATSGANQGTLYIDDIIIEEVVCGTPVNMEISNITENSATLSWEPPTGSNISLLSVYQYAVTETGIPPAEGTFNSETSVELTGLEQGHTYYVFTRSLCGPVWSDWSEATTFAIPVCDAATVPYSLDFETAAIPAIPDCTIIHAQTGSEWNTVSNPGNGFTNVALQYEGNTEAAQSWFFTQGIELSADTWYSVSYKFGNNSTDTTERLRMGFGTNPNANDMAIITAHDNVTGGTQAENSELISALEAGIYYFGFQSYSTGNQGNLYLDDIQIEEATCGTPVNVQITNITDSSADVAWAAPDTGNTSPVVYQFAYGTTDTPPAEGSFDEDMMASLGTLEPNTTYYLFTRTNCGPIWSDWTTTSFTTEATAGIEDDIFRNLKVYPNPAKNEVAIANAGIIDTVEIYNIAGQLVHKVEFNSQYAQISLSKLPAGAYMLNIYSGESIKKVKLLKQ